MNIYSFLPRNANSKGVHLKNILNRKMCEQNQQQQISFWSRWKPKCGSQGNAQSYQNPAFFFPSCYKFSNEYIFFAFICHFCTDKKKWRKSDVSHSLSMILHWSQWAPHISIVFVSEIELVDFFCSIQISNKQHLIYQIEDCRYHTRTHLTVCFVNCLRWLCSQNIRRYFSG